jgi:hypothetical protein
MSADSIHLDRALAITTESRSYPRPAPRHARARTWSNMGARHPQTAQLDTNEVNVGAHNFPQCVYGDIDELMLEKLDLDAVCKQTFVAARRTGFP